MQKCMIERNIPAVGKLLPTELRDVARQSNSVLLELGPSVQWVQSYITRDRMYCVYLAPDERWCGSMRCGAGSRRTGSAGSLP